MQRVSRRGMLRTAAVAGAAAPVSALGFAGTAEADSDVPELRLPPATEAVTPFRLKVPEALLRDLWRRLAATRWPERETVPDRTQGAQLERVRKLVRYWQKHYDGRRLESRLNRFPQFRTKLDGLGFHFLHVRSKHANALPLILTHGWPGSVVEFLRTIGPLTDPTAHGGKASDAFHVVVPSLPGYGFSDRPSTAGWGIQRTAKAWNTLMHKLGYDRYVAQGGDWGAMVTAEMARLGLPGLAGIHLNFFPEFEPPVGDPPTPEELEALKRLEYFSTQEFGYFAEQGTRPQTIGYGLTDSPVGQASWIYEKFTAWTDSDGNPESVLGYDQLLDAIMAYWVPATATSSARFYWEANRGPVTFGPVQVPLGFSVFPGEVVPTPKVWAERAYGDKLVYFNKLAAGGHFAAFEQPALFVDEVRKWARLVR